MIQFAIAIVIIVMLILAAGEDRKEARKSDWYKRRVGK